MEVYQSQDGAKIGVVAATWHLNPKVTFHSLAPEFRKNPVLAWRNYGSVVAFSIQSAVKDKQVILAHTNTLRENPWDVSRETFQPWFRGRPGRRYFLHFDLSKNRDATGIALVHREDNLIPVVDFMHRVQAPFGKDINYAYLRDTFVYGLTGRGFAIQQITYDQWQSVETRQVLAEKGYLTDEVSAEKSTGPYDTLIEQVLTKALDYYEHPAFRRELEELRLIDGKKYDHPKLGSKDVSDAVACALWSCLQYHLDNPVVPTAKIVVVRRMINPIYRLQD